MKNKRDLSDTMEVNVELARKAVGSLFFNENEDNGDREDVSQQEDAAHQRERWSEIKKHRAEKQKTEEDRPPFANTSPLPTPKPAVKVNPSIPVSRVPIPSERQPIAEEVNKPEEKPKEDQFFEDDDIQNSYTANEAGSDEGEFADFRQRLELARKAVDSLFLNEDIPGAGAEKRLTEKHSAQERNEHKNEIPRDKKPESTEPTVRSAAHRTVSATPPSKSEAKADKSVPPASRVPSRPERQSVMDEHDIPRDVKPDKDRSHQSRYAFEEDGEKDGPTPQVVKPTKTRPQSRFVFIDEDGVKEGSPKKIQPPKEHTARNRRELPEKEDPGYPSDDIYQKYRDIDKKAASKAPRPKPKTFPAEYASAPVSSGMPSFMRGIIAAFTIMLLLMMVFLIHRTAVLSERLEEANTQLLTIPTLEHELNSVRIDLEGARESLAAAEAENTRLTNLVSSDNMAGDATGEGEGDENGADDPADDNADAPATTEPAIPAAPPAANRTHTVVRGDSLSRISSQFYGSSAPSYIQRIMDANNITNPDNIVVGDTLIIP